MPVPVVAAAARAAVRQQPRLWRAGLLALALKAAFLGTSSAFFGGSRVVNQRRAFSANNRTVSTIGGFSGSNMPGATVTMPGTSVLGARRGAARQHRPGTWKCGCEACISFDTSDEGRAKQAILEKHWEKIHDMSVALPSLILPERSLRMRQSIPCDDCLMSGEEGPGGAVSGAGVALATYINKNAPPGRQTKDKSIPWRGMNVLELGSGTGVAGIAAAAEGATVLLTDKDDLMPLMAKNIRLNEDNMLFGSADYEAFDWAEPPPREVSKEAWDVVLCAESVTRSDDVPLFVSTLASLLSPDGAAAGATAIYAHNPMDAQSPDLDLQLQTAFKSHGLSRKSLPSLASQTTKQSCGDVECGRCPEVELDTVELWTLHSSSV